MRARRSHTFAATEIASPDDIPWQDWISWGEILHLPDVAEVRSIAESLVRTVVIKLNGNVVDEILAAASFGLVEGLRVGVGGYEMGCHIRRKYENVFKSLR